MKFSELYFEDVFIFFLFLKKKKLLYHLMIFFLSLCCCFLYIICMYLDDSTFFATHFCCVYTHCKYWYYEQIHFLLVRFVFWSEILLLLVGQPVSFLFKYACLRKKTGVNCFADVCLSVCLLVDQVVPVNNLSMHRHKHLIFDSKSGHLV